MKILVADDDVDQLTVRCLILERNGFTTVQASDAASALEVARREQPRSALIDLCLPDEESGWRVVRELKALNASIKIVLLTGFPLSHVARRQEASLVDEIMEKGSGSVKLVSKLKSWFPKNGSGDREL